ncbi:UDP-2,3-diacylglucosamine diphosphatase [Acinetobacter rathckeae]|uniref:UDP-2,3-diacylglucosamine diphosphatase n=1 Tax=Acinetobacter rathckeae TaxID=2605272 RepID=UPI0018A2CC8F|nr:UDP-2,3-diacylglucosamine diphosphatase [Acinetobacter rathckeae]MBF7687549.1 UDP-2,3-diacylglucosamine diphosphatase [Acinetobacter rathckeae]MBF7694951.1 UDP-2,3-diacylglucosamine diphosphatase [Acinetobacter rathckeae]
MATYLFISDLHLSEQHPRLVRGFFDLLEHYKNQQTQLYILGDWFNAWIGDDQKSPWLDEMIQQLQCFQNAGNCIYFQAGNRDFALGQQFLDHFAGVYLPDSYTLHIADQTYRLEHGDALCTDDISYQRFKKVIRHPLVLSTLKKTPLSFRKKLANGFRKKSAQSHQHKKPTIMDVNANATSDAILKVDHLIHGHTHRPQIHLLEQKQRIVLGDWREESGEAYILEISEQGQQHYYKWLF